MYDFSGWATRNDIECTDKRVIRRDAFKDNDNKTVPLVWNHQHNYIDNVLGHALLKNMDNGVYAYCSFNDTASGKSAKEAVKHGDIECLSIYANELKQQGNDVIHGNIREVSLVLAGANPGAFIDTIMSHSDDDTEEALIFHSDDEGLAMYKEDDEEESSEMDNEEKIEEEEELSHADSSETDSEKSVREVLDTLNKEQREVVIGLIGMALDEDQNDSSESQNTETKDTTSNEEDKDMKHNIFDEASEGAELKHSVDEVNSAIKDGKRYGSLKESFLQHGITDIEYLFPDARNVTNTPQWIKRPDDWVAGVMSGVSKTPFSRIKSMFADITEDEARAKGYIKGKQKKEEVFSLLKRTTDPQTVYKKQKLDRDDVIDITDFDVVAWLKGEMRMMLDEEIARAILVGDGRLSSDDDKIKEDHIRPIWTDEDLFTIKTSIDVATYDDEDKQAKQFIRAAIKARKDYRGSGNPVLYISEDMLTNMLLLTDNEGRDLYDSVDKLATKLRVSKIVSVPVFEGLTREGQSDDAGKTFTLMGLIVNLRDYNVGADKGGAVNMFDDFDIDYNAQKYLIETRCSGALIKPYSAIAIELVDGAMG